MGNDPFDELQQRGVMSWRAEDHAWITDPDHVIQALTTRGFQEYRHELSRRAHDRAASGGMWHGLDPGNGSVASIIWVTQSAREESHVFIEIDGRAVVGSAWADIDTAILSALAASGGRLTLGQIAKRVGLSESAVQSVVSMLAERGKVRLPVVELVDPAYPIVRPAQSA